MICQKCNTVLTNGAQFCHKCGTRVEAVCKECGKKLMKDAFFCAYCGASTDIKEDDVIDLKELYTIDKEIISDDLHHMDELSATMDQSWFANDKSVYTPQSRDFSHICYKERIYFLSTTAHEVWSMKEDTSDLKRVIIRDKKDDNQYIGVNRRGIFTYSGTKVYYYAASTEQVGLVNVIELQMKKNEYLQDLFIYDNKIYYITTDSNDNPKQMVKVIGIDGGNPYELYKGTTRTRIERIMAYSHYVLFYTEFWSNNDRTKGWYRFDIESGDLVNLNSSLLPPDELLQHPKKFDSYSKSYIEDKDHVTIFSFDLLNGIMWTFASKSEAAKLPYDKNKINKMIFPRKIGIATQEAIIKNIEPWILPVENERDYMKGTYLFTGKHLYSSSTYYRFQGVKRDGSLSEDWNKTGHGNCENIQLTGNSLIGDIYADYRDYSYPLVFEKPDASNVKLFDGITPIVLDRQLLQEIEKGSASNIYSSKRIIICNDITEQDISLINTKGFFYAEFNNFCVEENNKSFSVYEGSLYNYDRTKLLRFVNSSGKLNPEIILPETVEIIGDFAFADIYAKSISIPECAKKIEGRAFYRCGNMELLVLPENIDEIDKECFSRGLQVNRIQCPKGSKIESYLKGMELPYELVSI